MINPISAFSSNLGTPQRSFLWQVVFPTIIGGGSDTNTMLLRAQTASMPERSQGVIKIPFQQGPALQIPGKLEYPHLWDVTFVEGEDAQVMSAFYGWAQQMVDDVTNIAGGDFADVSTSALFQLLSADGSTVTSEYTFNSIWVQKIGQVTTDYENQTIIKIPITFAYQSWVISNGNALS